MKKKLIAMVMGVSMVAALAMGCSNTEKADKAADDTAAKKEETEAKDEAKAAEIVETYVNGKTGTRIEFAQGAMESANEAYSLQLLSDGTYQYTVTQVDNVYGSDAAIVNVSYGKYEKGESEDGITAITLENADRVIYNAYVGIGGVALSVDTDDESCFPAKLLGSDKADQTAEDYLAAYGAGLTVFTEDTSNCLYFENPAEAL